MDEHQQAAQPPVTSTANPAIYPHPSYAQMITAAIAWGNSQGKVNGSSKRAISKYMGRVYSDLPATHWALLTHNLTRLKNSGYLVMVKNSYQLASAGPEPKPEQPKRPRGRPPKQQQRPIPPDPGRSDGQPKRRPGRPPKKQRQQQPSSQAQDQAQQNVQKKRSRQPRKSNVVDPEGARPRGRPKKNVLGPVSGPVGKRPRGRPPRQGRVTTSGVAVGKRPRIYTGKPRGRPKKNASIAGMYKSELGQGMANEELVRKLENMQLQIRDAVGILRPHLTDENATDALKALQQLEDLSRIDLNAPPTQTEQQSLTMPMDATVEPSASAPAPQSVTALTIGQPAVTVSVTEPTTDVTMSLHEPSSIESRQPTSGVPSNGTQF